MKPEDATQVVYAYHQRTKHRFEAYAAGPDTLDWADQPEAFRWFEGSQRVELPLLADNVGTTFAELYQSERPSSSLPAFERLAILLERSLGLAAWKSYGGARWALRCNPSSGNLHPTEAYVVTTGCAPLTAGVYHYLSRDHLLERRCRFSQASEGLSADGFLIGLSSIHWREAWKYGERAFRYCQHDCGHAIAALSYAAAAVGWSVRVLDTWSDADIARVLGLDRDHDFGAAEPEHPDVMLWVGAAGDSSLPLDGEALAGLIGTGEWQGRANRLSPKHLHRWPIIDDVTRACCKPRTPAVEPQVPARPDPLPPPHVAAGAMTLFRRRRSAQAFDGATAIDVQAFYRMLDMTLPRSGVVPWDSLPWRTRIQLMLFVHRVTGLRPGVYVLVRDAERVDRLRASIDREAFGWEPVPNCPPQLPLYSLVFADCRRAAATLSCQQAIAGDSAFSLGMLAEFDAALDEGAWRYRQLFWEAGMLGHVLYLEAEAAGVSGTGIGCYFDDAVHELLGIEDTRLQSLYHFTVGGPLVDQRLVTTPPYSHLGRVGNKGG